MRPCASREHAQVDQLARELARVARPCRRSPTPTSASRPSPIAATSSPATQIRASSRAARRAQRHRAHRGSEPLLARRSDPHSAPRPRCASARADTGARRRGCAADGPRRCSSRAPGGCPRPAARRPTSRGSSARGARSGCGPRGSRTGCPGSRMRSRVMPWIVRARREHVGLGRAAATPRVLAVVGVRDARRSAGPPSSITRISSPSVRSIDAAPS